MITDEERTMFLEHAQKLGVTEDDLLGDLVRKFLKENA